MERKNARKVNGTSRLEGIRTGLGGRKGAVRKSMAGLLLMTILTGLVSGCGMSFSDTAKMDTGGGNGSYSGAASAEAAADAAEAPMAEAGYGGYDGAYGSADTGGMIITEDEAGDYFNTEEYQALTESGFQSVALNPLSTFSADVDTASYSNLRRMILDGYGAEDIPEGAVRIEEMLNYFSYSDKLPKDGEPFGVTTELAKCPWNPENTLLRIGLKTEAIDFSEAPDSNLVFLIDVSGSMDSDDKLGLLKRAFLLLSEELTEKDRVSIVTYAGTDAVLLTGARGDETEEICAVLENLTASGSTNGSAGILTAYRLAESYYIEGGNNRIILATDGDLNVGVTDESSLKELVEEKRESGIYLSVLGFGTGNLKDNKMETLADYGNGNYAYIDSMSEAKKVLVEELGANMVTVARDVKIQVEFNPAVVKGYRLIGYENRRLSEEDFADDTKDAGEIGAGHSVTALYEIVTIDGNLPKESAQSGQQEYRYEGNRRSIANENTDQTDTASLVPDDPTQEEAEAEQEWLTVSVRYQEPDEWTANKNPDKGKSGSKLLTYPVDAGSYHRKPSEDMCFAAAVAELGMVLRDSEYKGDSSFEGVLELLKGVDLSEDEYKEEFYHLVKQVKRNS